MHPLQSFRDITAFLVRNIHDFRVFRFALFENCWRNAVKIAQDDMRNDIDSKQTVRSTIESDDGFVFFDARMAENELLAMQRMRNQ